MREKKFNMLTKIGLCAAIFIIGTAIAYNCTSSVNTCSVATECKSSTKATKILPLIDNYQEQYFTIVKRNNVFLNDEDREDLKKDRKELKKLFKEVEKQITNKKYLKEYRAIEKRYAKCDEITTVGMNEFAQKNYNEVDALLNKVYNEVLKNISDYDRNNLVQSETKWLKEVEDYNSVFNSMGFGTIGTIIYYDYEINMRQFRTLLLMLYL